MANADTPTTDFRPAPARRVDSSGNPGYAKACPSAEVENTTTETNFKDADGNDIRLVTPADTARVGTVVYRSGVVTVNDNNSTDTLQIQGYITDGTTTTEIFDTTAKDAADDEYVNFEVKITYTGVGSSGTAQLEVVGSHNLAGTIIDMSSTLSNATASLDTTVDNAFYVSAKWSVAHADNEVELTDLFGRKAA